MSEMRHCVGTQRREAGGGARVVVLAMGNDLLGDDAVGFLAARALLPEFRGAVEVVETGEAGLALVELLEGYDKALLLDAAVTGRVAVGSILEYGPEDFSRVFAPSPHYAGLPEVLDLARRLDLRFPSEIRILAMEVADPFTVRQELTPEVRAALPGLVERARTILRSMLAIPSSPVDGITA